MALRNLNVRTLVSILDGWTNPSRARPVLEKLPLLVALLPKLDDTLKGLMATQRPGDALDKKLKALTQEATVLDAQHDRKKRAAYQLLSGLADATDDPVKAEALLDLRGRLMPEGLAALKHAYLDEAGDARLLPSRLDAASSALLKSIPIQDGYLSDVVDAWLAAAAKLERVEGQRVKLASDGGKAGFVTKSAAISAKNAAIRAVRAVESSLAMEDVDEAVRGRILGTLRAAEAKADRRASGGDAASEEVDDTVEPASGGDSPRDEDAPEV
jgi:hypothetical protein